MALSAIQRAMKNDGRLIHYALHNLIQAFIGLSNPDGEMEANELLHQVCMYIHMYNHNTPTLQKMCNAL